MKLKSKVDCLEEKIIEVDISRNKLDQYTRRNNTETQGIPATVPEDHLEDKMNLVVENSDIEGCHRTGKGNPKNHNCKVCEKKVLQSNSRIMFSK